jgi:hypothetical protein
MMMGTDYSHADQSVEIQAPGIIDQQIFLGATEP